ncbi:MAG: hypothetical protein EBY20_04670 [Alphaproteobacteria bacterium]|jgi:hypothetical protein|uniref:Uncharacterized protein n=1 Tax=viral metagenome TaxID=1070528 RepID=A0A6C0HQF7_9ZZZZ|nr:hypothetical protein [Alphaproteobacteria bacterium]
MPYKITNSDYSKILSYYGLEIPKKGIHLKEAAENILSQKLCSCIKKVGPTDEPRAIGVCTKTVLNRKGLSRGKFKCKNGRKIELKKTSKKILIGKKKTLKRR